MSEQQKTLKQVRDFNAMFNHTHTDTDLHTDAENKKMIKVSEGGCWPKHECFFVFLLLCACLKPVKTVRK